MKILEETDNRQFQNRIGKAAFFDYVFNFRNIRPIIRNNELLLKCRNNDVFSGCITSLPQGGTWSEAHISYISPEGINKIKNAFEYLFDILNDDERFHKKDSDPFSQANYKKNIKVDTSIAKTIKLSQDGNISTVEVTIGDIVINMILDSGASDVSISADLEKALIDKGIITKDSYLEPALYRIADGNIVTSNRVKVPSLKVGAFEIKDIICNINPSGDILLLGKSFLDMFSKWSIDNKNHTLILEK